MDSDPEESYRSNLLTFLLMPETKERKDGPKLTGSSRN